ncbi:MAG: hypothetical protein NW900_02185, partial [Candidatus Blochmannia sp. A2]|nr:hypothetical protein [Candidatus Blochmannia sp. A2]
YASLKLFNQPSCLRTRLLVTTEKKNACIHTCMYVCMYVCMYRERERERERGTRLLNYGITNLN